jgi:hypothetical protein
VLRINIVGVFRFIDLIPHFMAKGLNQ